MNRLDSLFESRKLVYDEISFTNMIYQYFYYYCCYNFCCCCRCCVKEEIRV